MRRNLEMTHRYLVPLAAEDFFSDAFPRFMAEAIDREPRLLTAILSRLAQQHFDGTDLLLDRRMGFLNGFVPTPEELQDVARCQRVKALTDLVLEMFLALGGQYSEHEGQEVTSDAS